MGIQMANKRFIAFLDSDDYWHENKLKEQIEFMLRNKISFSYTRYFQLDSKDNPSKIIMSPEKVNTFKLTLNNYIKTLTAMYDTKDIGKIYMPDYRKRQDWGLWFNILNKTTVAYCLPKPLAYYRTSNTSSLSKNKFLLVKENFNFYRLFLKKSIFSSIIMMVGFLIVHFYFKVVGQKAI
jgi:teichuronic acid biosynthesis glycosyltransferase TuaG